MKRFKECNSVLIGVVHGRNWQGIECWKDVKISEKQIAWAHGRRRLPAVVEFARRACADRDFQSCQLAGDSHIAVTRTIITVDDSGLIVTEATRTRFVPLVRFGLAGEFVSNKDSSEFHQFDT